MKYFGSVEMRDGQFVITEMDAHVRIKLKSIFNKIRKSQAPPYIFKVTNENCRDLLWFNSRYPMKVSAGAEMALNSGAVEHKRVQDELVSIFSADYKFSPVRLNEGMQLRDYQNRFVAMFDKTKRMMLADDVGCISGDAVLSVNRASCARKIKLRDLYYKFHGGVSRGMNKWRVDIDSMVSSSDGDGRLRLNKIKDVLYRGDKSVWKITVKTDGGKVYSIEATDDHEFLKDMKSWVSLMDLSIGDEIAVNGLKWCSTCREMTEFATYKRAKFKDECRRCIYRFKRKNTDISGSYIDKNGYRVVCRGLRYHPFSRKSGSVFEHVLSYEASLNGLKYDDYIERVRINDIDGLTFVDTKKYAIHHKDENKLNNLPKNLEMLTHKDHARLHGLDHLKNIKHMVCNLAKVIEIKKNVRVVDVYDLVMDDPHRNFVANGIVVHNCGKTPQVIGSILSGDKRPALVVVQTHLVDQWLGEIRKFSDLKAVKIDGRKVFKLPEADVYVTKYGLLQYWSDVLSEFGFKSVYFDEVQELRKSDSNKYEAAKNITKDVEFVCGATATPIYNYADEIWNIFNIIRPGFLGEYWDFAREWCNGGQWVKDPKALGDYLRSENIFLRRTATDVGRELPQLNKIVHTVEYDEKAVVEFESLAKSLAVKATTGAFTERGQAYRELDIMMRQITGVSKARYVAEYIKILLKNNEPVLVGVWHREVIRILMEELAEFYPVLYTGTESEKQKNESKRAFIAGETNCMLLSLRSGVGLDGLQHRARYVVFAELDWSPSIHAQFIGRLNRDGQEYQVTVIYLVSEYGSDPLMISLNGAKYSHATQITDPLSGGAAEQVSDDSRLKMLAERVLKGG